MRGKDSFCTGTCIKERWRQKVLLIAVAQFQARRSGLVNITQHTKCSKQLSGSSSHSCEQFDSSAELRVVGWDSRRQTEPGGHFQLIQFAQHQSGIVLRSTVCPPGSKQPGTRLPPLLGCLEQVRLCSVALTDPQRMFRMFRLCTEEDRGPTNAVKPWR